VTASEDAFLRLALRVGREDADRVETAVRADLPWALSREESEDEVELVFLVALAEEPDSDDLREMAGGGILAITRTEVAAEEARPAIDAGRFHVRPPWLAPSGRARSGDEASGRERSGDEASGRGRRGAIDLEIASGFAFGTGMHPTTQLCLELLPELEPGGALCDWGAGTGVLSIAAAKLGFGPVTAVEVDPSSLATIRSNALANGVEVTTKWLNLSATEAPWAPTVTANLQGLVIGQAAAELIERPPERMLVSGVMAHEAEALAAAYAPHGLRVRERRERLGWVALVLAR